MIDDLDKTLEALLKRELPADLVSQVRISFATPDEEFLKEFHNQKAIDLFLYDVRENRDLRTNEWHMERRTAETAIKKPPPVRVDCSYLVTAWGKDPADEHRLLGEVMKALLRYPVLPPEVLANGLKGQEPPLSALTLQPGRLQSLGEFWQALGGKLKAALHYTVTIGVEVHEEVETGLVTEKMFKFTLQKGLAPEGKEKFSHGEYEVTIRKPPPPLRDRGDGK